MMSIICVGIFSCCFFQYNYGKIINIYVSESKVILFINSDSQCGFIKCNENQTC